MASSEVEIVNSALSLVGVEAISSLADTSKEGRLANREYSKQRDRLLVCHPWNFAMERAELALDDDAPEFGFDARFALPSTCLRVIDTDLGTEEDWTVETGRFLLCNSSDVKILFIKKVTEVANFSEGFCEALSFKLAWIFAKPLTGENTLVTEMRTGYIQALRDAKAFDGQEGSVKRIEANEWLFSRL